MTFMSFCVLLSSAFLLGKIHQVKPEDCSCIPCYCRASGGDHYHHPSERDVSASERTRGASGFAPEGTKHRAGRDESERHPQGLPPFWNQFYNEMFIQPHGYVPPPFYYRVQPRSPQQKSKRRQQQVQQSPQMTRQELMKLHQQQLRQQAMYEMMQRKQR
ncbi:uncharacterized protein LOC129773363 [Toxorhynchites rutilus septentrionalis]|uniref:uncharacterized protein LOC129773363 n=1 Tax=Toxorhynchites rutilus septentrionalis TaxID=329112 RepID=UPI002479CCD0|nr:uncharacterized protein LOC129773363 [Toxorhynchites rutilus septentrionalis]